MFNSLKLRTQRLTENKTKLAIYIVSCIAILLLFSVLPFYLWLTSDIETRGVTSVRGNSMTPLIENNDVLYVQPTKFERGEIVVALCPRSEDYKATTNVAFLKRIVGLPGETIEMTKDGVLVNGELLEETYTTNAHLSLQDSNKYNEIILSDNEYFLLGDNRDISFDSRHVGGVHSSRFLYGLTIEPNEHTKSLWISFIVLAIVNLIAIIALPIFIFLAMTFQLTPKRLSPHQETTNKIKWKFGGAQKKSIKISCDHNHQIKARNKSKKKKHKKKKHH